MANTPREPSAMRVAPRYVANINNYLAQNATSPQPTTPRVVPATSTQAIVPSDTLPSNNNSTSNNTTALSLRNPHAGCGSIDLVRMEERSWQMTSEIDTLQDMTAHDLRALQSEIHELRASQRELRNRVERNEDRVSSIANTTITFASTMQHQAELLRQTAEAALPGITNNEGFVERTKAIEAGPTRMAIEAAPVSDEPPVVWITTELPQPNATALSQGTDSPSSDTPVSPPAAQAATTTAAKPLPPHLRAGKKTAEPPTPAATPTARRSHAIEIKKPDTHEVVIISPLDAAPANAATPPPRAEAAVTPPPTEKTTVPTLQQPHAVTAMGPPHPVFDPSTSTFTWEFLYKTLGGTQHSPGFNVVSSPNSSTSTPSVLGKGRTYWLLDSPHEPFTPSTPGAHGAKLTAFFNDDALPGGGYLDNDKDYMNVPVFVADTSGEYTYMGHYSQTRYSDMLSHSETLRLPAEVREYWAAQLSDPQRPSWVTEKLRLYFWPKPVYEGPLPADEGDDTTVTAAVEAKNKTFERVMHSYLTEVRNWEKDSRIKVSRLVRKESLISMFDRSDLDEEKGLRLWYEYLECVGYDEKFVGRLVAAKGTEGVEREKMVGKGGVSRGAAEDADANVMAAGVVEKGMEGPERREGPYGSP